jgi:hypothetical protein
MQASPVDLALPGVRREWRSVWTSQSINGKWRERVAGRGSGEELADVLAKMRPLTAAPIS